MQSFRTSSNTSIIYMLKKVIILSAILSVLFLDSIQSQDFQIVGLINGNLVIVDSLTAKLEVYAEISNIPDKANLRGLTFNSKNGLFYSIRESTDSPVLVSISKEGNYKTIGNFVINGAQIPSVETLAYNSITNKLYASVSLNGGIKDNDFYSEAIVEVDPFTGSCFFLTEVSTGSAYADVDAMTFNENILYTYDGIPPGGDSFNLYETDFSNIASLTKPRLIYDNSYLPINDFTASSQNLYFTENRNLYKYSFLDHTLQLIGPTHLANEYDGAIIQGISRLDACSRPFVNLGNDKVMCGNKSIILNATDSGMTYEWQDGSTEPTFEANESGIYWVDVKNTCGTTRDTIIITFEELPSIDLGEDRYICDELLLDATVSGATYTWQDGSTEPIFIAKKPGNYWVEVKNTCGAVSDTVNLKLDQIKDPFIPNVFTPNGDRFNQFFEIDERLVGSEIIIFNRWGRLVYESKSYLGDWDGSNLIKGTYYYHITDACNRNYKGWITIL